MMLWLLRSAKGAVRIRNLIRNNYEPRSVLRMFLRSTSLSIFLLSPVISQTPPSSPVTSAPVVTPEKLNDAISRAVEKEPHSPTIATKLQSPLEAVAQAWKRKGAKGVEREVKARGLDMRRWRLPCVIHLTAGKDATPVTTAVRRNWGEILVIEEDRVYAWIPIPALRRISLLANVGRIDLDRSVYESGLP